MNGPLAGCHQDHMANLDRVIFSRLPDLNKNEEITIPKWCWALILIRSDILHGNYLELTAPAGVPLVPWSWWCHHWGERSS